MMENIKLSNLSGISFWRSPDLTKSRNMLNFNPKTHWKEALRTTLDWYIDYYNKSKIFEGPDKFYN